MKFKPASDAAVHAAALHATPVLRLAQAIHAAQAAVATSRVVIRLT
ncbi:MAG: hypothetical protein AAGA30_03375 [Planctomycetota bacterium]